MSKELGNMVLHNKRLRAEKRFRRYGQAALLLAVCILVVLIGSIVQRGYRGFLQTEIRIPVVYDVSVTGLEPGEDVKSLTPSAHQLIVKASLRKAFPDVREARELKQLYALVSMGAGHALKRTLDANPALAGQGAEVWVTASSLVDLFNKGVINGALPEQERTISDRQIAWVKSFAERGAVRTVFNTTFLQRGDSRSPEQAGFLGAMAGSALTLAVCLMVAFPLGVMTAVYLEEFAKKSHRKFNIVDIIEVNINNLAAVPSIVFGLLGLEIYINVMGMPRSSPLVGGMTLALMILPVIIISTRVSLNSVPRAIRDAARGLGATPVQVVWHHVLPLAMPGIMTGTILGMARAIGETAPLIMIGMVAFVADVPSGFTTAATVMPVQIFLWASSPDGGFVEKTAAGILVLLVLLLSMNALAIYLRKRFEVRW